MTRKAFWLSHWASQYARAGIDVDNGYYIGIYAIFAVAGVLAMFTSVWYVLVSITRSALN